MGNKPNFCWFRCDMPDKTGTRKSTEAQGQK